jgi:hypothetical protein
VNVGGEEYKPRQVETEMRTEDGRKSIFLKAFTLIPLGFHFFRVCASKYGTFKSL